MDSRRWQIISRHLDEIAELHADQQQSALADLARRDAELAAEVRSLLANDDDGFLDALPAELLDDGLTDDPLLPEGTQVGHYRIVELLGEGGMGLVYLADRVDDQFERRVALKVIKRGMDTQRVVRRFQAERQILASLIHPNIATLFDGGVTDDGLPYFCMEYVHGLPIDVYCERHDLPLDRRLDLLQDACAAIQHAHSNLVVHGDLKPSNVLVDTDGRVKLLDFGIATLLDDRTGRQAQQTVSGVRPLTPDFASPEQIRGEALTTAADVWSLGALLHVLLTNERPHDLSGVAPHELGRALESQPAPCPSRRPVAWARRLRGDLDTVVQVSMHWEPGRRYATAMRLAEDLKAHLQGRPISARRDSLKYRAQKFVGRNRVALGLTVTAFLVTLGFAVTTSRQAGRIEEQSVEIVRQRDLAQEVTTILVDMFDVSDPVHGTVARGDTLSVLDFLHMNDERLTSELVDQPELQAKIGHLMSRLYANLGYYERALELVQRAVTMRRDLAHGPDADLALSLDFQGTVLHRLGRSADAESYFREALQMRRELFPGGSLALAEGLNNLAWSVSHQGRPDEALELDREALAMRRALLGNEHPAVAQSLNNLASSLLYLDRLEEAEPLYREALAIRRSHLGGHHPYVANTMNNLGRLLLDLGDLAGADSMVTGAIEIWSRALRPDHPEIAVGWINLARVAEGLGDLDRAVHAMSRALAIEEASLPTGHPYIAVDCLEVGRLQLEAGNPTDALPLLHRAHNHYLAAQGADHEDTQQAMELITRAEGMLTP